MASPWRAAAVLLVCAAAAAIIGRLMGLRTVGKRPNFALPFPEWNWHRKGPEKDRLVRRIVGDPPATTVDCSVLPRPMEVSVRRSAPGGLFENGDD
jgi:hypothetical protein